MSYAAQHRWRSDIDTAIDRHLRQSEALCGTNSGLRLFSTSMRGEIHQEKYIVLALPVHSRYIFNSTAGSSINESKMIGSILQALNSQTLTSQALITTGSAFAALAILAWLIITEVSRYQSRIPNIPGPTGLPIVGNYHQLAPDPAESLRQWSKRYGPVYQIMMGDMPVVIVNSMQAARDIFIGQGHSTVDRPRFYTFHSVLSSVASSIGTNSWNDNTKRRRKVAASAMNRPATQSYLPFIQDLTESLVAELLSKGQSGSRPFDPRETITHAMVDLTMTIHYGARLPAEPGLLEEIVDVEDGLSRIKSPLGSLQDYIPIMRYVPFANNSSVARDINRRRLIFLNRFDRELKERITSGKETASIASNCLKDPEARLDDVDLLSISMSMVSDLYLCIAHAICSPIFQVSGGLDTMVNTLAWTIGTLALRPDIQDTAYEAITSVYGAKNAPHIDDENGVPYITALMKEGLRQFSTLRLSLPRAAYKDIEYGDLLIPKGTTMFLNVWAANHDEGIFGPDVHDFKPERYLNEPEMPHASYGFGTRMCAGFHLANRQLYVLLLMLIWSFKIEPTKEEGERGWQMRPLEVRFTTDNSLRKTCADKQCRT